MFARSALSFAILAIGAGIRASAQSVSQSCQSAVLGLTTDPAASTCLNSGGFINLALQASGSQSLVQPVTDWVQGMCSAGACNDQTLAAIVTNVTAGCASDLQGAGLSAANTDQYIKQVQAVYPTIRKVLCLKDTSANNLCVTQELNTLQSALGQPLTLQNILSAVMNFDFSPQGNVSSSDVCTSCTKASYTIIKQDLPQYIDSSVEAAVQQECGADFTDGNIPSQVQLTAASGTVSPANPNAAMRVSSGVLGVTASSVLVAMAGFVFLA